MKYRYRLLFFCAVFVLVIDQVSKWFVVQHIPEYKAIPVIPGFFDLVNVRNRGAAFGFLNRSDIEWQFWLFLGATLFAVAAILYIVRTLKEQKTLLVMSLGCILGGALGNLTDRVRFRAVVDFLDVYWNEWHWPAFNIADTAICLGACVVCFFLCFEKKDDRGKEKKEQVVDLKTL
ncbi:MAG: signal peptidase II [Desulfovibrio sp.]|nr:signal peptidase II [Desulfovibrio sp.]